MPLRSISKKDCKDEKMSIEANLQFKAFTVHDASTKQQFQEKEDKEKTVKKEVAEVGKNTTQKK
jgi:hypothetical protein